MAGLARGDSEASSGSEGWHWRAGAEHPVKCEKGLQVPGEPGAAASLPFSRSVVSDSATPWIAARQASLSLRVCTNSYLLSW